MEQTSTVADSGGRCKAAKWLSTEATVSLFVYLFLKSTEQPFLSFFFFFLHYKQPVFPSLEINPTADQRIVSHPTKASSNH